MMNDIEELDEAFQSGQDCVKEFVLEKLNVEIPYREGNELELLTVLKDMIVKRYGDL